MIDLTGIIFLVGNADLRAYDKVGVDDAITTIMA
jgi:hypothetical protein